MSVPPGTFIDVFVCLFKNYNKNVMNVKLRVCVCVCVCVCVD